MKWETSVRAAETKTPYLSLNTSPMAPLSFNILTTIAQTTLITPTALTDLLPKPSPFKTALRWLVLKVKIKEELICSSTVK
jgi:hypothetical protein